MYCGDCKNECDFALIDFGIGPYEFWGRLGVDKDKRWVSDCCESEVFQDEDLKIQEDDPDPEADRADYLYDLRKENGL